MKDFTKKLQEKFLASLESGDEQEDPNQLTDQRMAIVTKIIDQIRQNLRTYVFDTEDEEIHYFKFVLPATLSLHFYYSQKAGLDRIQTLCSEKVRHEYYERFYLKAEHFRLEHKEFLDYTLTGRSDLDQFYFLRKSPLNRERNYQITTSADPTAPTVHCVQLATFIAFTRLERELQDIMSGNHRKPLELSAEKPMLIWGLSKVGLVEIIYALKEMGAFNDGKADLAVIQECFEKMFGVSLGNTSRSFQEILARKKGHTSFLDQMKESLMKRIQQIEDTNLKTHRR